MGGGAGSLREALSGRGDASADGGDARPSLGGGRIPGIVEAHGLGGHFDEDAAKALAVLVGGFVLQPNGPGCGTTPETTSTSPATRSGRCRATSSATAPPSECPTITSGPGTSSTSAMTHRAISGAPTSGSPSGCPGRATASAPSNRASWGPHDAGVRPAP